MRLTLSMLLVGILLGGMAVGVIAYQSATPYVAPTPPPVSHLEATVEARVADIIRLREASAVTPTPTPVTVDRATLVTFAQAYLALNRDWNAFDREFDALRQDDISQAKEKVTQGLSGLLTTMQGLASDIRALPKPSELWQPWNTLAQAVEKEEQALRKLQQTWKPGDVKPLDDFDKEKQAADEQRRGAERELSRRATPPTEPVLTFANSYAPLGKKWDEFHAFYTALKLKDNASEEEVTKLLGQLVSRFRSLSADIKGLSRPIPLRETWSTLASALEKEELALVKLQEAWKKSKGEAIDSYEKERDEAEKLRRQAEVEIAEQSTAPSAEVLAFSKAYEPLGRRWDTFHDGYATWRLGFGAETGISSRLTKLAADPQKIVEQTKALPRPQLLVPTADSLTRAAEREQRALLRVRETWRPLDPAPYDAFELERDTARELKRQAVAPLENLLRQQGLSLKSLAP